MRELEKEKENNPQQGLKMMPDKLQEYIKKQVLSPEHNVQWKVTLMLILSLYIHNKKISSQVMQSLNYLPR